MSTSATQMSVWAFSSKGQIVILGRIVSASRQIFRSDFRPQDEIFHPRMPFRPLDEQALSALNQGSALNPRFRNPGSTVTIIIFLL